MPTLTTPNLKETLYVYLAASGEAVSGVLMADRRGKQTPVRLRRYFEAHPIKVITADTQQTRGIRKASQVRSRARRLQHCVYAAERSQRPGAGVLLKRGPGGNWKCRNM
ncbi:hypothetical protein Tco_0564558 [Tanacetum coccineum]